MQTTTRTVLSAVWIAFGGVGEVEVVGRHGRDIGKQILGPRGIRERTRDLRVDDRAAVALVELDQLRPVEDAQHRLDRKAFARQQFGQLRGAEFAGVERVDRGVAAGGEGDPVRRRHQQHAARPQYPEAFGYELPLIPQVFDHLEVDDDINSTVR